MAALTVSAADEKRVKALGFLNNKGTDNFSGRIITVNGKITAAQQRRIAEAAEKFGNGNVTFTTRLTVEVQGIPYDKIEDFRAYIREAGLETGGTGSLVRPVVACKGTTCQYGLLDSFALSEEIHHRFYEGYHTVKLPHKFKIAVGGCPNNCVKPDLNDLGIIGQRIPQLDEDECNGCKKCSVEKACPMGAAKVADGLLEIDQDVCNNCGRCVGTCHFDALSQGTYGFKIYIGGRWGKKVAQGRPLSKIFTDKDEALNVIEKAILLFREQGKTGERFAKTIERLGFENVEKQLLADDLLERKQQILDAELHVSGGSHLLMMKQITDFPNVPLAVLPTPLYKLENLSRELGRNLYIKRDDMTGVALGGNKVRKLEFLLADAKAKGADTVLTAGGPQSNHAMLTAACASRLGMRAILVLKKRGALSGGNQILNGIFGAEVRFVDTDSYDDVYAEMERIMEGLRGQGHVPYFIPVGGSVPLGCLGYVNCALEIAGQAEELGVSFDSIVSATGSGGTYAGLTLGAKLFLPGTRSVGIGVCDDPFEDIAYDLMEGTKALLESDVPVERSDIHIRYHIGPGYAQPSPEGNAAVERLARGEGILVDPVYTGKALAGFFQLLEEGYFDGDEDILFVHTGGAGALFAPL